MAAESEGPLEPPSGTSVLVSPTSMHVCVAVVGTTFRPIRPSHHAMGREPGGEEAQALRDLILVSHAA